MKTEGLSGIRLIAVDFGNSTTKIAARTGGEKPIACPVSVPGFSCRLPVPGQPDLTFPVVPSLIHYIPAGGCLIGSQVTAAGYLDDPATVKWMHWYLRSRSPVRFPAQGRLISYPEAASDFIVPVLSALLEGQGSRAAELVFVVPPGSDESTGGWLAEIAEKSGFSSVRVIDAPAAAAAACLPGIQQGDPFMVIDIGGDRTEVTIVAATGDEGSSRSRVLGSASADTGGRVIDRWFCEEVMQRAGLNPDNPLTVARLLPACREAKEALSCNDHAPVRVTESETVSMTGKDLEQILESRGFFAAVGSTIEQALNSAFSRGYTEATLTAVIMAGGTSSIPCLQERVIARFAAGKVIIDQPLGVLARGAAVSSSGTSRNDRIQHEYAIRVWDPPAGAFDLKTLVKPGTQVPSQGPVARIRIQATYDGQARMGIPLYERQGAGRGSSGQSFRELVVHQSGTVVVTGKEDLPGGHGGSAWINERTLALIPVDPPAVRGEPRLEVWFSIDASRQLRASARDIRTGKLVMENHPLAQLR
jgi:molecular chaperone DnaK (HSP70)